VQSMRKLSDMFRYDAPGSCYITGSKLNSRAGNREIVLTVVEENDYRVTSSNYSNGDERISQLYR